MGNRIIRSPGPRPRRAAPTSDEADRVRLVEALSTAGSLLPVLGRLLAEPAGRGPATGTIGRHAPESSEPWNAEAAHAYWTIYFGVRQLAAEMARAVGTVPREYGAGLTDRAMTDISQAATAVPAELLAAARRTAEHWVTVACQVSDIDTAESWTAVPRVPGAEPPLCPYCKTLALRMSLTRLEVRCFNPDCRDHDARPVRARMERGRISGEGRLYFGDGTVVAYREEH